MIQTGRRLTARGQKRHQAASDATARAFLEWAASGGFIADREPVDFEKWRFLGQLYALVPADPIGLTFTIRKAAQTGASTWAMLLMLWTALRWRMQWGYFLPTRQYAMTFSQDRFIKLARENPAIHRLMGDPGRPRATSAKLIDEGSAMTRRILSSIAYFLWMEGKVTTEALPLDGLVFDEVQEMLLPEIAKAEERISASDLKLNIKVSTAHFEGADIDFFYQQSDKRVWRTRCGCSDWIDLAQAWDPGEGPLCIVPPTKGSPAYYRCPTCQTKIANPQDGDFIAEHPDRTHHTGVSWSQMVSPKMTAGEFLLKWENRIDTANFYWRALGRCYTDPKTVPVTVDACRDAQRPELTWGPVKRREVDSVVMGIDQMGFDKRAVVKARVQGEMRLIWLEIIQGTETWERVGQLMREFKVQVCCVEQLPEFDSAQKLARDFPGRVWIVDHYGQLESEIVLWGDRPKDPFAKRMTDDEGRTPFTARVDQYRAMSWSLARWQRREIVMPDARTLVQTGVKLPNGKRAPVNVAEMLWQHLSRVQLVTVPAPGREDEHRFRRAVKKIGADPHFAFANMLCDIAWMRVYGTTQFLVDSAPTARTHPAAVQGKDRGPEFTDQIRERLIEAADMPGGTPTVTAPHLADDPLGGKCGSCVAFTTQREGLGRDQGFCTLRQFVVQQTLPGCSSYDPRGLTDDEEEALYE